MNRFARLGVSFSALAFGVFCMVANQGQSANFIYDAKEAIAAVSAQVGKNDSKALAEIAKKYSLDEIMHAFKFRAKGGIGVGDKAGAITPDGIEAKLQGLMKKAPDKADLQKNGKAYAGMGDVSLTLAELTEIFTPKDKKGEKDPKKWKEYTENMRKGAKDLSAAATKGDGAAVQKAAKSLYGSCTDCHGIFRD